MKPEEKEEFEVPEFLKNWDSEIEIDEEQIPEFLKISETDEQ